MKRPLQSLRVRRQGRGYALEGPGFYVWDEDPREVRRVAAELQRGNAAPRPARRMLVLLPAEEAEPRP